VTANISFLYGFVLLLFFSLVSLGEIYYGDSTQMIMNSCRRLYHYF